VAVRPGDGAYHGVIYILVEKGVSAGSCKKQTGKKIAEKSAGLGRPFRPRKYVIQGNRAGRGRWPLERRGSKASGEDNREFGGTWTL